MPARRHLQAIASIGMALAPIALPTHLQPTLIGRRAAQEIIERVDQHSRELARQSKQAQQATAL
ncbi:MAG: hypothetical protein ACKVP3_18720 [Hyphomicrobiaceae bacterium]